MDLLVRLYEPYMPLVYGSCLKYLKNEADAQDAVMDIFEKIAKKTRNSEVANFKAWLYTVTRNHCFEKLRSKRTKRDKEIEASVMYSDSVFHPDNIDNEEEISRLTKCLEQLDGFQKKCIELFYFRKMSYAEISERLELKYNQVRSRIQNGRRNLKICMESFSKSSKLK